MIYRPAWTSMLLGSIAIGAAAFAAALILGPALVQIAGETAARIGIIVALLLARFAWARAVSAWMWQRRAAHRRIAANVVSAAALGWIITAAPLLAISSTGASSLSAGLGIPLLAAAVDLLLCLSVSWAGILASRPATASALVTEAKQPGILGPRLGP